MTNLEHYFENLIFSGKDVAGDLNKKELSKEEQEAVEACYYYICYSFFKGRDDLTNFIYFNRKNQK